MSGSSGGGFGGGTGVTKDCETLTIRTHLASPIAAIIAKLKVGEILTIELTGPAGPVSANTKSGELAGSVLHMDIDSLIQCISTGHEFQAKVIEIKGGNCEILIKHK